MASQMNIPGELKDKLNDALQSGDYLNSGSKLQTGFNIDKCCMKVKQEYLYFTFCLKSKICDFNKFITA